MTNFDFSGITGEVLYVLKAVKNGVVRTKTGHTKQLDLRLAQYLLELAEHYERFELIVIYRFTQFQSFRVQCGRLFDLFVQVLECAVTACAQGVRNPLCMNGGDATLLYQLIGSLGDDVLAAVAAGDVAALQTHWQAYAAVKKFDLSARFERSDRDPPTLADFLKGRRSRRRGDV